MNTRSFTASAIVVMAFVMGICLRYCYTLIQTTRKNNVSPPLRQGRRRAIRFWKLWSLAAWWIVLVLPILVEKAYADAILTHFILSIPLLIGAVFIAFLWTMKLEELIRE
jgi:hypothetical protein